MPQTTSELLTFTNIKRLQNQLTKSQNDSTVKGFMTQYLHNNEHKAQFLSKSQPGASAFLRAIPSDRGLLLANSDFTVILRLYLRLPVLPFLNMPAGTECHCHRKLQGGLPNPEP
jgi:hypothetical protein